MSAKTYNVAQVSLVFGGIPLDSGFGKDTVFVIEPEGELWGDVKGADGEVCRYATNEKRFTLTVKLLQSSEKNAVLSALVLAGQLAGNGSDVGSVLLKDQNGTSTLAAGTCWIAGLPTQEFGVETGEREWKIRGVWDLVVVGGN